MQEPVYQTLETDSDHSGTANYGYELIAFVTTLLIVVFIGLLPALAQANLKQLPFCLVGMAFVFGALLAYHHQHHARFWAFTVAAVLITTGF